MTSLVGPRSNFAPPAPQSMDDLRIAQPRPRPDRQRHTLGVVGVGCGCETCNAVITFTHQMQGPLGGSGGGISIGHPPGATGIRMTITAMHHLADTGGRYAVISMCLGSGMGMADMRALV